MAIETRLIGSYTEIYIGGGNAGFLTQSYPTNFHSFFTRKILAKSEKVEDFKEVTAAQRSAIEASDASWQEPPALFIELWNQECKFPNGIGVYNSDTGFFELNGLTDITYADAKKIYEFKEMPCFTYGDNGWSMLGTRLRTNLFKYNRLVGCDILANGAQFEVFRVASHEGVGGAVAPRARVILPNCIKIIGQISAPGVQFNADACSWLESIKLTGIFKDVSFGNSPKLSYESLEFMITNAKNTGAITITVHKDVYDKIITGETIDGINWSELLTLAEAQNIAIAPPAS